MAARCGRDIGPDLPWATRGIDGPVVVRGRAPARLRRPQPADPGRTPSCGAARPSGRGSVHVHHDDGHGGLGLPISVGLRRTGIPACQRPASQEVAGLSSVVVRFVRRSHRRAGFRKGIGSFFYLIPRDEAVSKEKKE